jgi:hypothetical protein
MTGNNKYGAAGRGGVPASTVVAFLDHYVHEGYSPEAQAAAKSNVILPGYNHRTKRINGVPIPVSIQRSVRRWRNGDVERVSAKGLAHVLDTFGFTLAWFHGWAKLHRKPIK